MKVKSFAFALRVVKLAKILQTEKNEFVLSKQVLRSGTAIGALVREAEHAESKADFSHKMNIALKEANETLYWLELLHQAEFGNQGQKDIRSSIAIAHGCLFIRTNEALFCVAAAAK